MAIPQTTPDSPTFCPACGNTMRSLVVARQIIGEESVDVCSGCQALWFDAYESSQLSPGATLELFDVIVKAARDARTPLPTGLRCPRCTETLALTQDLQRTTRFSYYRCPYGHGRLTPFFQFLREKNFVRAPAPSELARLKASLRVIRCSSCGAPVDLEKDTACPYCRAPIAILDPDAVASTVTALKAAEGRRTTVNSDAYVDAMLEARRTAWPQSWQPTPLTDVDSGGFDLVCLGLAALSALVIR